MWKLKTILWVTKKVKINGWNFDLGEKTANLFFSWTKCVLTAQEVSCSGYNQSMHNQGFLILVRVRIESKSLKYKKMEN